MPADQNLAAGIPVGYPTYDLNIRTNGLNEADRLRAQWVSRAHNVPRIIDQSIESVSLLLRGLDLLMHKGRISTAEYKVLALPAERLKQAQASAVILGEEIYKRFPWAHHDCGGSTLFAIPTMKPTGTPNALARAA